MRFILRFFLSLSVLCFLFFFHSAVKTNNGGYFASLIASVQMFFIQFILLEKISSEWHAVIYEKNLLKIAIPWISDDNLQELMNDSLPTLNKNQ
jgi:K+ transporter